MSILNLWFAKAWNNKNNVKISCQNHAKLPIKSPWISTQSYYIHNLGIRHPDMSPSSSGSWSGSRGADIIDLDRYMRGAVRPSRAGNDVAYNNELIVDAGGIAKQGAAESRHKHYSHDSGVSDSSYSRQRRHHKHLLRRVSNVEGSPYRKYREYDFSTNKNLNSNSLHAFRTVCEQALLDQQRQIAHVAQLCEQLTLRAAQTERKSPQNSRDRLKTVQKDFRMSRERFRVDKRGVRKNEGVLHQVASESSDISSSSRSRSTRDQRRKDRYRTDECKTYKIIMSKLDELNRLFNSKPPPLVRAPPRTPSTSSVSVCDKFVSTDPDRYVNRIVKPSVKTVYDPSGQRECSPRRSGAAFEGRVTHAFAVDIAPAPVTPNVFTECVVKCERSGSGGTTGDPCCNFDLEDPVHLYAQAKRLQVLQTSATEKRPRSASSEHISVGRRPSSMSGGRGAGEGGRGAERRAPSLCAICRGYWRAITHCIVSLAFPKQD